MKYCTLMSLFLTAVISGLPVTAEPASTILPDTSVFSVSIAAPEDNGQRIIALSTADPHFDVVIRNQSAKPQRVWAEDNSNGYDALSLEVLAIDNKVLSPPVVVRQFVGGWFRNRIRTVTLEPGDVMVREVHLAKDIGSYVHYQNFPTMSDGASHKIRMRAVFTNHDRRTDPAIWSGQVVSNTDDYLVWQSFP